MLKELLLESDNAVIVPERVELWIKEKCLKYFGSVLSEEDLQLAFSHHGEVVLDAMKSSKCIYVYNSHTGSSCIVYVNKHDSGEGLHAKVVETFGDKPAPYCTHVITV